MVCGCRPSSVLTSHWHGEGRVLMARALQMSELTCLDLSLSEVVKSRIPITRTFPPFEDRPLPR